MSATTDRRRSDAATRVIDASAATIYQAFATAEALRQWLLPAGMSGRALELDVMIGSTAGLVRGFQSRHQGFFWGARPLLGSGGCRTALICLSQPAIWFQLAEIRDAHLVHRLSCDFQRAQGSGSR
jgi:hypothetical protein